MPLFVSSFLSELLFSSKRLTLYTKLDKKQSSIHIEIAISSHPSVTGLLVKLRKRVSQALEEYMPPENSDVTEAVVAPTEHENPPVVSQESDQNKNWAAARQITENLEQTTAKQAEYIRSLEAKMSAQAALPVEPEIDELDNIAQDEWLTRAQSEKLQQRNTDKALKKMQEEWKREQLETQKKEELEKLPQRIKAEMPDFDQVVSKQNVEYLRVNNPHVAAILAKADSDPYAQAKAAYSCCKSFCASPEVQSDKEAMKKNALKPGSLDAIGTPQTQSADPRRFSSGDRDRRWKAMQQSSRR